MDTGISYTAGNRRVRVAISDRRYDIDSTAYHMGANPKGYMLIIKHDPRPNTTNQAEGNAQMLDQLFDKVGYRVIQKSVSLPEELMTAFDEFNKFLQTCSEIDSILIYIIANVEPEHLPDNPEQISIGGQLIPVDAVIEMFTNDESFRGKPKVFFFQSTGIEECQDEDVADDGAMIVQSKADCLVVLALQPSIYPCVGGSICLNAICNEIMSKAHNTDLETMMMNVSRVISTYANEYPTLEKPIFTCINTSFKKLYFNPGLYDQP